MFMDKWGDLKIMCLVYIFDSYVFIQSATKKEEQFIVYRLK